VNREDQFIPHLVVNDGMAALKFYREVFAADEGDVMMEPDGKRLMHGEIVLDGHKLFLSDEFSEKEGGTCKMPQTSAVPACASRFRRMTQMESSSVPRRAGTDAVG
jgi:PhnB protein